MKRDISKIGCFEYRQKRRLLNKRIEKAIRQHKKRSHIRKELDDLFALWVSSFGIGLLAYVFMRTAKRRSRKLRAAISNNNPLLEKMRSMGNLRRLNGGKLIRGEIGS